MSETQIPYIKKHVDHYTRETFHASMDAGNFIWPTTEELLTWWEEWFELHPEEQKKADILIAESNAQSAGEFMLLKIMLRSFFENNRQASTSVFNLKYTEKTKVCRVSDPLSGNSYEFRL